MNTDHMREELVRVIDQRVGRDVLNREIADAVLAWLAKRPERLDWMLRCEQVENEHNVNLDRYKGVCFTTPDGVGIYSVEYVKAALEDASRWRELERHARDCR